MSLVEDIPHPAINTTRLIFYPLVLLATCLWLLYRWQQQTKMYKLGNKLPGPIALPIFGNALLAVGKRPEDLLTIALEYVEKYGSVVRGWLGSKLIIFLTEADDVEVILNSQVHIDKASDYRFFKPWLGNGLLISSGEKWRTHRKIIAPTFHTNILKSFVDIFNQNSRNVVNKMKGEMGKVFDVHDYMSGVTVDILLECAQELFQLVPPSPFLHRTPRRTAGIHPYVVNEDDAVCDIMRTAKDWNNVPAAVFPAAYDVGVFKRRVNRLFIKTAMGITKEAQDESGFDYAMAVMKMCDIIHQRHYKFWLRFDSIFKLSSFFEKQKKLLDIIHGLTNKVIKIKKEIYYQCKTKEVTSTSAAEKNTRYENSTELANTKTLADTVFKGYRDDLDFNDENDVGEKKRLAFLDLLLETAQSGDSKITDNEIKEQVDTIMFEGHDTTAAGSSFVLCLLGIHQNIQARVYNELCEIFGDSDRPATFEDTLHMKYLERVIFESLRMYPPVPMIARKLTRDVKIATNNYVLPAGATVVIGTFKIHRNEKHYKNPNVFDPDNFLPENTQNRHYYSYIPFSAGPRSCVGRKYALLKLKILLSTVLRNYKMVSDITEDQFVLQGDIILKRTDGFRVQIEPRKRVPIPVL